MRNLPRLALPLLAGLLVLGPGCISYAVHRIPHAEALPAPPAPDQRPTVSYSVRMVPGSELQGTSGEFPEVSTGRLAQEFPAALARCGWFRTVQEAKDGVATDVSLDAVLVVRGNDVVMIASAMLAFIIPTWRTVEFDLTVEARAADGRWQRYHLQDAARDVHWLPLLLGMSFAPWGDAYADVRENLYRTLLAQLHADGFLQAPAVAP
jgi:hypothetical protein